MEKKIIKKSPIWPLRHQEDVVAIYIGQGKSLSQPYHSILMSEMNCINGEDVGTLLGLGCH